MLRGQVDLGARGPGSRLVTGRLSGSFPSVSLTLSSVLSQRPLTESFCHLKVPSGQAPSFSLWHLLLCPANVLVIFTPPSPHSNL